MRFSFPVRCILLSLFLCAVTPQLSRGQTDAQIYSGAARDFENGKFEEAQQKYRSLFQKGLSSADLYYNLGSTLYRLDRPGEAALWYRRALVLDPGLTEASQSLRFLQHKTGYLEFAESDLARFIRAFSAGAWKWITSIGFWTFAILLAAAILFPKLRRFRPLLLTFSIFGLIVGILAFQAGRYRERHLAAENFVTVVAGNISALTSPVPDSASVIELPPGSELRITQDNGPWLYADAPGELRGWVRAENVAPVWPPSTEGGVKK